MARLIPAKEAAKVLGLKYDAFLRKVRLRQIQARKIGWVIVMTQKQLEKAKRHAHH